MPYATHSAFAMLPRVPYCKRIMVKLTSVASVIQYSEILRNAQTIYYANNYVIELLFVAAIWYLAVVTVLSIGQHFLERYFAKGQKGSRAARPVEAAAWSTRACCRM